MATGLAKMTLTVQMVGNLRHGMGALEEPVWRALVLSSKAKDGSASLQPTVREEQGEARLVAVTWSVKYSSHLLSKQSR